MSAAIKENMEHEKGFEGVSSGSQLWINNISSAGSNTSAGAIVSYLCDAGDEHTGYVLEENREDINPQPSFEEQLGETEAKQKRLKRAITIRDKRHIANDFLQEESHVFVQRHHLVRDINGLYRNNDSMLMRKLSFTFLGEDGIDVNGVTRDGFATYWEKCREIFECHSCRTSLMPVKCDHIKCDLFSSILVHSFVLTGQMPYYLPQLFVLGIICSIDAITPSLLKKCVQLFIELHCKDTQDKLNDSCKSGVSDENLEELQLLFCMYGMPFDPATAVDFKSSLKRLVLKCLFIKPPCFVQKCSKKLKEILGPLTAFNALEVLDTLQPTGRKIIGRLNLHSSQAFMAQSPKGVVFSFLKVFLLQNGQNIKLMRQFLKFVTGSSALTEPNIYVQFGEEFPYPRASTCSCTLTLPTGVYGMYKEFEIMFIGLLDSEYSQTFTDD